MSEVKVLRIHTGGGHILPSHHLGGSMLSSQSQKPGVSLTTTKHIEIENRPGFEEERSAMGLITQPLHTDRRMLCKCTGQCRTSATRCASGGARVEGASCDAMKGKGVCNGHVIKHERQS